jgi:Kdo2-lipid IVA lauroyltransferase/acyltransferase
MNASQPRPEAASEPPPAASGAPGASSTPPDSAAQARGLPPRRENRRSQQLALGTRDRLLYWLMVGFLHALSVLPDFVLYPIGAVGGWLGYELDRRHVRIGMRNLAIAFPDKSERERARILRASYINLGRTAAEYVRLGGFFHERLRSRVSYRNLELWNQISARHPGKGALVLTAHFGNFELLPAAHAMHGYQVSLVHHTQSFLAGDALVIFVRERAGVEVIRKHSAARAVLKAVSSGEFVGIPFDQNAKRSEAVFVPFFGEPAATSSGLARIAMRLDAPVVPAFIIRQPDNRSHVIEVSDEVAIVRTGNTDADIAENTARFVKVVEGVVRRYPEQFLWTHRRFRTRPRGMPPIYDWEAKTRSISRSSDRGAAGPRKSAQHRQDGQRCDPSHDSAD